MNYLNNTEVIFHLNEKEKHEGTIQFGYYALGKPIYSLIYDEGEIDVFESQIIREK